MKTGLGAVGAMLIGVTMLPALLANGDPPALTVCGIEAGPIEVVLGTIRSLESGGDYTVQARGSTASGAYQFLDSSWAGYGGYQRAADAPPETQDAKATELIVHILGQHDGDVSAVPVIWYIGHLPATDSREWDTIPYPDAGNRLTPREYQTRWLTKYDELLAATPTSLDPALDPSTPAPGSCFGGTTATIGGEWALPGPKELIDANPAALSAPHHDYPAWDWIIPTNTPIYAVHGGTVATVHQWPHNWWANGCGTNSTGCQPCGVGLTIADNNGTRWSYCHGTNLTVTLGDAVAAGQQIMWSGNSGRSGTPHLHLEIRTVDGKRVCPQRLLESLRFGGRLAAIQLGSQCWY